MVHYSIIHYHVRLAKDFFFNSYFALDKFISQKSAELSKKNSYSGGERRKENYIRLGNYY